MAIKIYIEDGLSVGKGAGIGQHTLGLVEQLKGIGTVESVEVLNKRVLSQIPSLALRRALYIGWLNSRLQFSLRHNEVDIIHFTNFLIPALRLSHAKYVVTIHDLAAWVVPDSLPAPYVPYIRIATKHAVRNADMIVTVSDTIRGEIRDRFGVEDSRIQFVYNGVSKSFWELPKRPPEELMKLRTRFGIKIDADVVLFVGTLEKRKNLHTLIKAVKLMRDMKHVQLVLVGRPGFGYEKLQNCVVMYQLADNVIQTGYVTEEEKIGLYDLATVFAFPSLYEGFGIPLVEAMSRGLPIVASRIPSSEEIVGNAGLFYEAPSDHEALAGRVLEVLHDVTLQRRLSERGIERARNFSMEHLGKSLLEAYQHALEVD